MESILSKFTRQIKETKDEETCDDYVVINLLPISSSGFPFWSSEEIRVANDSESSDTEENRQIIEPDDSREINTRSAVSPVESLTENFSRDEINKFAHELDSLKIRGLKGIKTHFSDDNELKRIIEYNYAEWRKPGKKTSIPSVRIPRQKIRNEQMSKPLRSLYKGLNKGERAEDKLYRLFVNEVRTDDAGFIILPNVEGVHIFKKGGPGSVEIDMIVAHPQKGIFVFNVKNEQKANLQKIKYEQSMQKHSHFVRLLSCYNGQSKRSTYEKFDLNRFTEVPIHNVFVHVNIYPKNKAVGIEKIMVAGDKVILLQQTDLKNFVSLWEKLVRSLPDMADTNSFDLLVARLIALSLASNGHIHQKFASNDIQSIQVKEGKEEEWIIKQLDEILIGDCDIKCELIELFKKFSQRWGKGKLK